jgi:hypothetical protein
LAEPVALEPASLDVAAGPLGAAAATGATAAHAATSTVVHPISEIDRVSASRAI